MLSNAYFLAKFRFDTAENEPAKNLQNFAKKLQNLPILQFCTDAQVPVPVRPRDEGADVPPRLLQDDSLSGHDVPGGLPPPKSGLPLGLS